MIGISGIRVGHWSDPAAETGCTVLMLPEHTTASCEVRGGAPASRELAALAVDKAAVTIDAIVLTGGSAFGLAAVDGVLRRLEECGRGVPTPAGPVPLVPAMALFDLAAGDPAVRPTAAAGYAAAQAASGAQILRGRIGAGTGAYTSQWRGEQRRPGGIGYAERTLGPLVVGALCAVNSFGDIDDGRGDIALDSVAVMGEPFEFDTSRTHTTIGAVVTNARLDKTGCLIAAQGAHDGLARALTPPHTRYDGDGFIAAATGSVEAHVDTVRLMAVAAVAEAIRSVAIE